MFAIASVLVGLPTVRHVLWPKLIWRVPKSRGSTPKWMVYFMENPNLKWMITGGTPILGNGGFLSLEGVPHQIII